MLKDNISFFPLLIDHEQDAVFTERRFRICFFDVDVGETTSTPWLLVYRSHVMIYIFLNVKRACTVGPRLFVRFENWCVVLRYDKTH